VPITGLAPGEGLVGIDSSLDVLVTQGNVNATPNNPNGGLLFTVGALGVDTSDLAGFDVSAFGAGFFALSPAASPTSTLDSVNLATGTTTSIGTIGGGAVVRDIALVTAGL
jgi:hypothetical protein